MKKQELKELIRTGYFMECAKELKEMGFNTDGIIKELQGVDPGSIEAYDVRQRFGKKMLEMIDNIKF